MTAVSEKKPATRSADSVAATVAGCLLVGTAVLTAILEVFLTPLRWGVHILPLAVLIAVLVNVVLVALARFGLGSGAFGVAIIVAWLVPVIALPMLPRSEGDVVVPGGGQEQWVYFAMLLLGGAAGIVTRLLGEPSYSRAFNRLISR
jgi:hypothetical protein